MSRLCLSTWMLTIWHQKTMCFGFLLLLLGSTCVFPSSETRRKRDHTEGEEGRAVTRPLLFMVSILFRVMLIVVQGLSVRRRCEAVSERVERGREWESFFLRERDNRRILKGSDFHYAPLHQSTVYNKTQNKQEITSKSLSFTWKTPGGKQEMRSGP